MLEQVVLASLGAVGFGAIFGLPRKKLWIIAAMGAIAWWGYIILEKRLENQGMAIFIITVVVVICAKIFVKEIKCPAFVISTPVLIPFIPGATLYLVMNDFVGSEVTLMNNLDLLWQQVGAIVAGNLVAEVIYRDRKKEPLM